MPESLFSKFSIGSIVSAIVAQATAMLRHELEVAKAEIVRKLKGLGIGAGFVSFALVFIMISVVLLVIAGVAALTEYVWPLWLSALVSGGGVLLIGLIFLWIGAVKIKRNKDLRPERAISAMRAASKYFD